jgi:hypothetical protein
MLLDADARPIPQKHKFGQFHIPDNTVVRFDNPTPSAGQTLVGWWRTGRDRVNTYCQSQPEGHRHSIS